MPQLMVLLDYGQCIIKMKLFLILLLLAHHKSPSPDFLKGPPRDTLPLPRTPFPQRKPLDEKKAKRDALAQPPTGGRYDYDDDDPNKENRHPGESDEDCRHSIVQYLLDKWAADIISYQERVLTDLSDLQKKLGIPQ
ncbi:E4 [Gammapapillomavirus 22]|uniref:E4 n=1 Tax=Gammapapillomavirus 22 TaxID=1961679 RepID=A0A2D2AM53_9PAPI|nr:E4 [Gammapapillomavirus 22]